MRLILYRTLCGGEGGIRTRGAFDSTLLFESSTLNHSDTSPREIVPVCKGCCHSRRAFANGSITLTDRLPGSMRTFNPSGIVIMGVVWPKSILATTGNG